MDARVQDVLFVALERAMRERRWVCPKSKHVAHPALVAGDIVLQCSSSRCNHIHPISDQTLSLAMHAAQIRCPRCHSYLRRDRHNGRVVCSNFPVCAHRESWEALLPCRAAARADAGPMYAPAEVRGWDPIPKRKSKIRLPAQTSGLSQSVIADTVDHVMRKQGSDPVQAHHFQVRVAIQQAGPDWKTSVAIVPPDERGAGVLVDVRALIFFDRSATIATIWSRLEEWRR